MDFNFDNPETVIEFLRDVTDQANYERFKAVAEGCLPERTARILCERYMDEVAIPLGEMYDVARKAHALGDKESENQSFSTSQRDRNLSKKMSEIFTAPHISAIRGAITSIRNELQEENHRIGSSVVDRSNCEVSDTTMDDIIRKGLLEKQDRLSEGVSMLNAIIDPLNIRLRNKDLLFSERGKGIEKIYQAIPGSKRQTAGMQR